MNVQKVTEYIEVAGLITAAFLYSCGPGTIIGLSCSMIYGGKALEEKIHEIKYKNLLKQDLDIHKLCAIHDRVWFVRRDIKENKRLATIYAISAIPIFGGIISLSILANT